MEQLKRYPVDSSMVSAIAYDRKTRTLYVEFVNTGNIYAYENVPEKVFKELLKAESVGRYMRSNIIDCYATRQVSRRSFR